MATTKGFCIAGSIDRAITTMEIDWRWERTGQYTFKDPNGVTIHACSDCTSLRGLSPEVPIYFGHEAHMARNYASWYDWWIVRQEIADEAEDA